MAGSYHTTETALAGVQVQTSLLGQPIPIGWGRAKISCNLIDYVGFKAIPHTTKTGGKGGSSSSTTYTYTASIIMSLGEGPVTGIRTVYRDSSTLSLSDAGLSLATGGITQSPWGYMTSLFPSHALGYSSLAYVYAQDYQLGSGASLSNHSFEVDFAIQMSGLPDADPKDVATDFLTNVSYGVTGWISGLIGDLSDYSTYCRANGLLLSPVLDSQSTGSDFLKRIAGQSNSEFFWSEGLLKAKPYGDAAATGNGVTWTPNLTPIFDLDEDDFLSEVSLEIVDQSDAYNSVSIEFLDRSNQYQPAPQPAYDLDNIVTFGLRKRDIEQCHDICDADVARKVVQLKLQRTLYIRDRYTFDLPEDFIALEPMDYVTLTTTVDGMKLNRQLVLIDTIDEAPDGVLTITAEGIPGQTASAALYPAHVSAGYQPAVDVAPGNVISPFLFNGPTSLATQDHEVWCAVAGGSNWGGCFVWISFDDTTYTQVGQINNPARYGTLSSSLASHADPDTTNTLHVALVSSDLTIGTATHAEADAGATLMLIDSEILAYADATLTSAGHYDLSYLRRGLRGTAPAAHSSGAAFVRLDDAIFKFAYDPANQGATVYVKFQSYNHYGRGLQDLAGLTAYTVGLAPNFTIPTTPANLRLSGGGTTWTGSQINVLCDAVDGATSYEFDFYDSAGTTLLRSITNSAPAATYTSAMASSDGIARTYQVKVKASNSAGASAQSSAMTISNAAPDAVTTPAILGSSVTATATCDASSDPDLAGYCVFYSGTSGFDPATTGGVVLSGINSIAVYGLAAGTYYGRIAAIDPWSSAPALLNLSSEISFTITTGGGGTPSGGGTGGGGYGGRRLGDGTVIP